LKKYYIKEIFYTLQGEGQQSGTAAVFCRFSKCNLWSGRESDREKAICKFCDTDFLNTEGVNGGEYTEDEILKIALEIIPKNIDLKKNVVLVVFTGGEPALQLTKELVDKFKNAGFRSSIETNGTILVPDNLDWITVSPKANTKIKQIKGNEIKIVYPQEIDPREFSDLNFDHFYLSPMTCKDEAITRENIKKAINYCLNNPKWRISYQNHKVWQIP
jgi:7-carboxy-7-deazaguanine synthase